MNTVEVKPIGCLGGFCCGVAVGEKWGGTQMIFVERIRERGSAKVTWTGFVDV